nr:ATP-binding protein [uncultured Carboxylicivirga sp.]
MFSKKLKSIYLKIIPDTIHFKNRFALKTIALGTALGFIATMFNILLELDVKLSLFTSFITVYFGVLYFLARVKNKYLLVRKSFAFFMLINLNGLWILNGGSQGPTIIIFQAIFALGLFIVPPRSIIKVGIIFAINITGLFLLEYLKPDIIHGYTAESSRLLDLYHISIILFISEIPLIYYANKTYKTEQIKAEKSEQIKSAFLANMSHEIRTPMNVLLGFSELLRDNEISDNEKNQYLDIIQQNGTVLLHILDNVLDLSKLDANTIHIKESNIQLEPLLESLQKSHLQQSEDKQLNIEVQNKSLINDLSIITDEQIIIQIFNNLINNSIKFTQKGKITIGYKINENGSKIIFFVKDTGIGIHPNILPFVFERFRQGDERLKREFSGAGLGLTISKGLIELLNGKIWIKTAVNMGTTVYFSIDLVLSERIERNHFIKSAILL